MKSRFIVIAMGLSLGISAARGTPTLFITEFPAKPSFTFDHFVATFNGAPASFVTIELTSAHAGEQWTITFSDGWTLDLPNDMRFDVEIGEPEGGKGPFGMRLENFLTFDFGNQIQWSSEHENTVPRLPLSAVVPGVLLGPKGQRVDIRVADAPESSSTITLFGIGLAGLASLVRFRRTAV